MPVTKNKKKTESPAPALVTIQATITKRIFYNAENGYCVLSLDVTDWGDTDTENADINSLGEDIFGDLKATGSMPTVREGDTYKFIGNFITHPKFGLQFKFTSSELVLPSGRAGVARYISQITNGVGVVKAQRIIDALGEDALTLIQENPEALNHPDLSFLTPAQRADIAQDLTNNTVQAELAGMLCRPGSGIGMGTVIRIMAEYGDAAVTTVKENPYILTSVYGISFHKADAIAQAVGIAPNSPFRVEAAISFTLQEAAGEGHVYLEPNSIVARLIGRKGLVEASGVGVGDIAAANRRIIDAGTCVREGDAVYDKALYEAECGVAAAVRRLAGRQRREVAGLEGMVDEVEKKINLEVAV